MDRLHKELSLKTFINIVATDLQQLVRLEAASDINQRCQCISCGKWDDWRNMQGGHYISRKFASAIFDEANVWPQCKRCNSPTAQGGLNGNEVEYRKALLKKIGRKGVNRLEKLKKVTKQWGREELADLRDCFKIRIKVEKKRLGIK